MISFVFVENYLPLYLLLVLQIVEVGEQYFMGSFRFDWLLGNEGGMARFSHQNSRGFW